MTRHLGVVLALAPLLLSSGAAQSPQPQFRSRTLSVRVDVLVTDGRKPVTGLSAADFELRDNGVLQAVVVLDAADVPLTSSLRSTPAQVPRASVTRTWSPRPRHSSPVSIPRIARHW